jgi:hypothetical protein
MLQGILEQSAVQKYPIGFRHADGDRVFHYSKAGGDLTAMKAGHQGHVAFEGNTRAVVYAAGTYEVAILDGDASHGVDYYKNGYIWIMDLVTGIFRMHKIKSSTASNSTYVTLTLYEALTHEVGASTWTTAWPCIYSNVLPDASTKMSNVCVPLIPVTSSYYFWGQTWGPCFGTAFNVVPGLNDNQREVYFNIDGALMAGDDLSLDTTVRQRAGFILTNTTPGGDQFYMLQLAP